MDNVIGTITTIVVAIMTIYLGFRHDKRKTVNSELKRLAETKADKSDIDKLEVKRREDVRSIYSDIKAKAEKTDLCEMEKRLMDAMNSQNTFIRESINSQNTLIRDIHKHLLKD
jgi:hypothetical protein